MYAFQNICKILKHLNKSTQIKKKSLISSKIIYINCRYSASHISLLKVSIFMKTHKQYSHKHSQSYKYYIVTVFFHSTNTEFLSRARYYSRYWGNDYKNNTAVLPSWNFIPRHTSLTEKLSYFSYLHIVENICIVSNNISLQCMDKNNSTDVIAYLEKCNSNCAYIGHLSEYMETQGCTKGLYMIL